MPLQNLTASPLVFDISDGKTLRRQSKLAVGRESQQVIDKSLLSKNKCFKNCNSNFELPKSVNYKSFMSGTNLNLLRKDSCLQDKNTNFSCPVLSDSEEVSEVSSCTFDSLGSISTDGIDFNVNSCVIPENISEKGALINGFTMRNNEGKRESNSNNIAQLLQCQNKSKMKDKQAPELNENLKCKAMNQSNTKSSKKMKPGNSSDIPELAQVLNTAKQLICASSATPKDNDIILDMISLVNPDVGEILRQLQPEKKPKRKEKTNDDKIEKSKARNLTRIEELENLLDDANEKYDKLKNKAMRMRNQYSQKSTRLKQLQGNMRLLIDRYKEFKRSHENCDEQRQVLRSQLLEIVSHNDESEELVREFNETRIVYADKIKTLQEENTELKAELEQTITNHQRNETTDRELKDKLSSVTERLSKATKELKDKEEDICELNSEMESNRLQIQSLQQHSKELQDEIVTSDAMLKQKEFEMDEMKIKLKVQEKTIKHLQLAYNLVLTDQDISSRINVINERKCKFGGDYQNRLPGSSDHAASRLSSQNDCSNNVEIARSNHNFDSNSAQILNSRPEVFVTERHDSKDIKSGAVKFEEVSSGHKRGTKLNDDLLMKHLSFCANNIDGESPTNEFSDFDCIVNNSHFQPSPHFKPNDPSACADAEPDNGVFPIPDIETKEKRRNEDESTDRFKGRNSNKKSPSTVKEDSSKFKRSTIIVDTNENFNKASNSSMSRNSIFERIKTPRLRDETVGKSVSSGQRTNLVEKSQSDVRGRSTETPSIIRRKPAHRSSSVPKHVTFAGVADKDEDFIESSERMTSPEPFSSLKMQSVGAHPLLYRRRRSESNPVMSASAVGQSSPRPCPREIDAIQRKLDSLNCVIQSQEMGIQFLRDQLATITDSPRKCQKTASDAQIKILSLINEYGKPVPNLFGMRPK